jgi:hypothetical protein
MDFSMDPATQEKTRATRQFCEKHIDPFRANWGGGETVARDREPDAMTSQRP